MFSKLITIKDKCSSFMMDKAFTINLVGPTVYNKNMKYITIVNFSNKKSNRAVQMQG